MAKRLYCYVDESGQDTHGELFIVSVVVCDKQVEQLLALCERFEIKSAKGRTKWGRSEPRRRMEYMRMVLNGSQFVGCLCYSVLRNCEDFDLATIEGIAMSLQSKALEPGDKAKIYVDALAKVKRHQYGVALRRMGLLGHEIKGVPRDENNALIRLADAVAGFVRDALTGQSEDVLALFEQGTKKGILVRVHEE